MSALAESFQQTLRIARYSVYPRAASGQALLTGFTRDAVLADANTGADDRALHLVTTTPEAVGELLRVRIQDLNEHEAAETLARVVECDSHGEGRFELTLEALDAHRPRFVRRNPA